MVLHTSRVPPHPLPQSGVKDRSSNITSETSSQQLACSSNHVSQDKFQLCFTSFLSQVPSQVPSLVVHVSSILGFRGQAIEMKAVSALFVICEMRV